MDEPQLIEFNDGYTGYFDDDPAIVQALAVRKWAYENNLVGPDGQPRKIIGTLPVTADGVVVGNGAEAFYQVPWSKHPQRLYAYCDTSKCYSTREAAERAAKETS